MGKDGHGWLKRLGAVRMAVVSAGNGTAENPTSGSELRQPGFYPERVHGHAGTAVLPCLRAMEEQGRLIHPYFWRKISHAFARCFRSHGSPEAAAFLRRRCEELLPDMLVLLGDYLYHGPRNPLPSSYGPPSVVSVFADFDTPIVAVRGNCDAEVDLMLLPFAVEDSAVIAADGLRIVAQHGHHLPSCPPIPGVRPGDVVLSGHTHIPRGKPSTAFISGTPAAQRCPRATFRLLMASSKPVRSVCSGLTGGFFWSIGLPQP